MEHKHLIPIELLLSAILLMLLIVVGLLGSVKMDIKEGKTRPLHYHYQYTSEYPNAGVVFLDAEKIIAEPGSLASQTPDHRRSQQSPLEP